MHRINFLLPLIFIVDLAFSQDSIHYHFPDGLYHTLEDFKNKTPDSSSTIRKLNFMLPTAQAFKDTLTDHVWFVNKENDRIEKIFAVVHQGEIYLHEYAMNRHVMPDLRKPMYYNKHKLHRVHERGNYFYGVRKYTVSTTTSYIDLSSQFGVIDGLTGALLNSGTYSGMYVDSPFLLDYKSGKFILFSTKRVLKQFMNTFYPDDKYEPPKGRMDMEEVRHLFISLNSR